MCNSGEGLPGITTVTVFDYIRVLCTAPQCNDARLIPVLAESLIELKAGFGTLGKNCKDTEPWASILDLELAATGISIKQLEHLHLFPESPVPCQLTRPA